MKIYKLRQLVVSLAAVLDIVPSFEYLFIAFFRIIPFVNMWNSVSEM
jgi:hypothetical protein